MGWSRLQCRLTVHLKNAREPFRVTKKEPGLHCVLPGEASAVVVWGTDELWRSWVTRDVAMPLVQQLQARQLLRNGPLGGRSTRDRGIFHSAFRHFRSIFRPAPKPP